MRSRCSRSRSRRPRRAGLDLRGPLLIVVVFGIACSTLLVVGGRVVQLPLLRRSRRLRTLTEHIARHTTRRGRRDAIVAWFYLFACWSTRAFGSAALLTPGALLLAEDRAHRDLPRGRRGRDPDHLGGAVVNAGAAAAILLALGVGKDIAINFSLASGLLLVLTALTAAIFGVLASLAITTLARRNLALAPVPVRR